ncbi:MAG TPA: hypothetical protein VK587_14640 [bacterium]|nr:hypothetical protein [bacterium]
MTMDPRTATEAAFRDALARLGFPASDDEQPELWRMATDLQEQAAELRRFLEDAGARAPFVGGSPADGPRST